MVINFANVNLNERPILILKNAGGKPLGVLGHAYDINPDIKYNEISRLSFTYPAYADGKPTPHYDNVVGMRLVELQGIGQFILDNPTDTDKGVQRLKEVKAYSLEYELVRKNFTLAEGTYKFFDDVSPDGTLLAMLMEFAPSWSIGTVSDSLKGKYRTFDAQSDRLYNFMKSTVQQSVGCIFEFDTLNRVVHVRDVNEEPLLTPVFMATQNLASEIQLDENTEDISTRVSVNGAEGVDIRDVNPTGTNQIINLSYFMTERNFSPELIERYFAWEKLVNDNRASFYSANILYTLKLMEKTKADAELTDLRGEYTALDSVRAVTIQAISEALATQTMLDKANADLAAKQEEINTKVAEIKAMDEELEGLMGDLTAIRDTCAYSRYFTAEEQAAMDPYMIDNDLTETSFVSEEVKAYTDTGTRKALEGAQILFSGEKIESVENAVGATIYDIRSATVAVGDVVSADVISAVAELKADGTFVITSKLSTIQYESETFPSGCITITGNYDGSWTNDGELCINTLDASMHFTLNASEYDRRSVSWDLYEYAEDIVRKSSQPSYSFKITSANFLSLKEFIAFRDALRLGEKVYIPIGDDYLERISPRMRARMESVLDATRILKPILTGVEFSYEDLEDLTLYFGDSFLASDSNFRLTDMLEKSVTMGKNLDASKYIYSQFKDSGASTGIKEFMNSALDVAKNSILSSGNQAVSWDAAGLHLRKWANDDQTAYTDEQIWMANNSIVMTDDNWATAKLAIGKFHDENLGDCWGIVAPMLVGTVIAGSSLMIESAKKSGDTAVFKIDGDGCRLYNADFDIYKGANHITLNPDIGIAIGKYPLYNLDEETGDKIFNEENANFYADSEGNLHIRGMLTATALLIESVGSDGNVKFEVLDDHISAQITSNSIVEGLSNSVSEVSQFLNGDGLITKVMTNTSYYDGQSIANKISDVESKVTAEAIINTVKANSVLGDLSELVQSSESKVLADAIVNTVSSKTVLGDLETMVSSSETKILADAITSAVERSGVFAKAEQIITADQIVSTVKNSNEFSTVTQTADAIDQRMTRGNLVSIINQTADTVAIDASNIKIGNFIYGNADAGGGVPGALYTGGQLNSGSTTSTGMSASNADWAFWAGSGAFRVAQNGYLRAENAYVVGTLKAGNWTFNSDGSKFDNGSIEVNMVVGTGTYGGTSGSSTRAFYNTKNCDAQYGADNGYWTIIRGGVIKCLVGAMSNFHSFVMEHSGDDESYFYNEDGGSSTGRGDIGLSSNRWATVYCNDVNERNSTSSRRIKHNINSLQDVGDIIDQLQPVSFIYNWDEDQKTQFGLIYEDTINVLPEICKQDKKGDPDDAMSYSIRYTSLIPILLKEIQSLRARVAALESHAA